MEYYEKAFDLAVKFGIPEDQRSSWINDKVQECLQRDERLASRQSQKEEMERELQKEERQKDRDFELEKLRLSNTLGNSTHAKVGKIPKFQSFDSSRGQDIDVYLQNFARHASLSGWKKEEWGRYLFNLLSGDALGVLLSLKEDDVNDYDKVKDALLRQFGCTKFGFQNKFRSAKIADGECFDTYVNRILRYFDRWLTLSDVDSFEDLRTLIILEQVLSNTNSDFASHIKEKNPKSLVEVKDIARNFLDARPNFSVGKTPVNVSFMGVRESFDSPRVTKPKRCSYCDK